MGGLVDEACKAVVAQVSGAVACAVVDLDSGFVLGAQSASALSMELTELMARTTLNLLRGPDVTMMFRMALGGSVLCKLVRPERRDPCHAHDTSRGFGHPSGERRGC